MASPTASRRCHSKSVPVAGLVLLIAASLAACSGASASASPNSSPSGGVLTAGGGVAGNGNGNGGGPGNGNGAGNGNGGASPAATPEPTPSVSPSPTPGAMGGPYMVKQTRVLGGEAISGFACSTSKPFTVSAHTNKASWVMLFSPRSGVTGKITYAYKIPSAGESHDASGTYTISTPGGDGVLHLSFRVTDQVAFHGFSGPMPLVYTFDLVPAAVSVCPG